MMSVSLIVLRFEIKDKSSSLQHLEYCASSKVACSSSVHDFTSSQTDWPVLISEKLLSIHRGQREHSVITITSLDQLDIEKEMAELCLPTESSCRDDVDPTNTKEYFSSAKKSTRSGGIPRDPSKESTPGPSNSKEGTPMSDECGYLRTAFKDGLQFISGNPTVDVTQGILHLFKENSKTSLDEGESRSEMLCMLGVPTSMTSHDLLQFTAPCSPSIQNMRIIRNTKPNQYMVLIKFRTQNDADLFFTTFNGQTFNSIEPDICRLVFVSRVESTSEIDGGGLPIPGHSELPTCPVCLERMDESVDGILTILCNHSFHGDCLGKWGDTSCPVCRYCQTPEEVPDQFCLLCGSKDSLWICLICGHVGCGRYVGGHAHRHFLDTNHLFSLQVGNNRVWDYVRDNYVHRLLQSEGDGKVVSFERGSTPSDSKELSLENDEKLNSLQLEYTHLLSSQLESQREYFEAKLNEMKMEILREVEEKKKLSESKSEELSTLSSQCSSLKREKQNAERKYQNFSQKLNKLTSELNTEREMNLNLREGKKELSCKIQELESSLMEKNKQVQELEGQVRDIMAHLDAMNTIGNDPELQGGAIGVSPPAPKISQTRKKKR